MLRAMSWVPYLGRLGSAGTALLHICDRVMTVQRGARRGVPKAVVVLTGGQGAEDAAVPAQRLRNSGVSIWVVSVGSVLRGAPWRLAGPRDSLIHVAACTDLRCHKDALIQRLCGGEWAVHTLWGCLCSGDLSLTLRTHHYKDHSCSQLLNPSHVLGSV